MIRVASIAGEIDSEAAGEAKGHGGREKPHVLKRAMVPQQVKKRLHGPIGDHVKSDIEVAPTEEAASIDNSGPGGGGGEPDSDDSLETLESSEPDSSGPG